MSSSVYSSSWMQLKSLSRPWISGRRFCTVQVRRDSSQVCSVHGTPGGGKKTTATHSQSQNTGTDESWMAGEGGMALRDRANHVPNIVAVQAAGQ